jgi:nucleoside-diphosphate-sugar epimerase
MPMESNMCDGVSGHIPAGAVAGMTTVVTGAAGFVGSHLVTTLRESGAAAVGADLAWIDPPAPDARPRPGPNGHPTLVRVGIDLRYGRIEPLVAGADVVFHLAGLPGVWPSWSRFDEYLQANVLATKRLLDACLAVGVPRVVLASSSSIYGHARSRPTP